MSVGLRLKEIRKSAGLTVEQLSARTRIPSSVIEDLERDNFSTCGGPTYARGHIRTITRVCGVDESDILLAFESQTIPLSKSIRDLLNDTSATPARKERKPLSWKAMGGVAAGIFLFALVGVGILSSGNNNQSVVTSPTTSTTTENSAVAKKIDGVEVALKGVNGLSWVAVSDSTGTTLYSGRVRQGEEKTFTDNQLLYVVIGNAGAINLTVNGENLGVPGKVGEVVRLEFGPQASNQG